MTETGPPSRKMAQKRRERVTLPRPMGFDDVMKLAVRVPPDPTRPTRKPKRKSK